MATQPSGASQALPTTDTAAQDAAKTVGALVSDATTAAENALIAWQPWLAFPVFKQIWQSLFSYFLKQLGIALGTFSSFVVIDVQKYNALMNAAKAQAALNAAKQTGDPNAIAQASSAVDAAVAPILHYVGDAHT